MASTHVLSSVLPPFRNKKKKKKAHYEDRLLGLRKANLENSTKEEMSEQNFHIYILLMFLLKSLSDHEMGPQGL